MRVHGRVFSPDGELPDQLSVAGPGEKAAHVAVGADGSFLIDLRAGRGPQALTILRDGAPIGEHLVEPDAITGELALEVPRRATRQRSAAALALDAAAPATMRDRLMRPLDEQAAGLGIGEDRIIQAGRLFDELDDLSRLGLQTTLGDAGALERLAAGIGSEIPFDFGADLGRFKPAPGGPGFTDCRGLPSAPSAVVFGAALLDLRDGTDRQWAGKAVTAVLRRSEPAMRISRALDGAQGGLAPGQELADALEFATRLADPSFSSAPVHEQIARAGFGLREPGADAQTLPLRRALPGARLVADAAQPLRGGFAPPLGGDLLPLGGDPLPPGGLGGFSPPGGFGGFPPPGGGTLPQRPGLGTLLDPCNLEWLNCIHTFFEAPPPRTPDPPAVGAVAPTDIPAGAAAQITLTPQTPGGFGDAPDPGWSIMLGSTGLAIFSWDADQIVADIPVLEPGCYELSWSVDLSAAAGFFERQSAACAGFFGMRPRPPLAIGVPIGTVSIVGAPKLDGFTANGMAPKVVTLGCTPVTIAWDVKPRVCAGSAAVFDLTVTDDTGATIGSGLAAAGSIAITTDTDRIYTIDAGNTLPGQPRQAVSATLEVERVQAVTSVAVTPARPLKTGEDATITVTLSCVADDDVVVSVTSDRPNRLPSVQIPIAAGQSSASQQVTAGDVCGKVNLSAVVSGVAGYPPATTVVQVHNPRFDSLVSSSLEQCDGGTLAVRVSCALNASSVTLTGSSGTISPDRPPQITASQPQDPAAGTIQLSAHFGPLASGSYTINVFADGASLRGGQVEVAMAPPKVRISTSRNIVQICGQTDVTVSAQATRATKLTIANKAGSVVGSPKTGTNPCLGLDTQGVVSLSAAAEFIATAERMGAASATASAQVAEGSDYPLIRSWVFTNNLPPKPQTDAQGKYVLDGDGNVIMLPRSMFAFVALSTQQLVSRLAEIKPGASWEYTPANCALFDLRITLVDDPSSFYTPPLILLDTTKCLGHSTKGIPRRDIVHQLPSLFPGP